jgi:hypothetical protein
MDTFQLPKRIREFENLHIVFWLLKEYELEYGMENFGDNDDHSYALTFNLFNE